MAAPSPRQLAQPTPNGDVSRVRSLRAASFTRPLLIRRLLTADALAPGELQLIMSAMHTMQRVSLALRQGAWLYRTDAKGSGTPATDSEAAVTSPAAPF
jgi:hypothetical protein